jgi:predicted dehydrogenase
MKALVVGAGSIGRRHLQNLKALGIAELAVVDTDPSRRAIAALESTAQEFSHLDDGLSWSPDFVVLATPTHLHAEQVLRVADGGFHLFVEKPLTHTPSGLGQISDSVRRRNVTSLVGCNMRFHPGPAQVQELLVQNVIGEILFARVQAGSYLPNWRPGTDYRTNYAAREETGGGCILDCIHEIDLTRWYLGDVQQVFCLAGQLSSLEIGTEDVAALVCRHFSGSMSEIHLDYVQRSYERSCQIVGELGTIFWDFVGKQVRWYDGQSAQWTTFSQPESWVVNQMYLDEMEHFIECVQNRRPTVLPIPDAANLMQVVFAAKTSAREGRLVSLERGLVS